MKELLQRYTSRKLLITVGGAVALFSVGAYDQVVILLLGYVGIEGGADIVSKYKGGTLKASDIQALSDNADDYEVDTSKVETGKPAPMPLVEHTEDKKE